MRIGILIKELKRIIPQTEDVEIYDRYENEARLKEAKKQAEWFIENGYEVIEEDWLNERGLVHVGSYNRRR